MGLLYGCNDIRSKSGENCRTGNDARSRTPLHGYCSVCSLATWGHTSTDSLGHLRTCAEIIIFHANKTYAFEYAFILSSSLQRCVVAPYPSSSAATRAERSHLLGVVTCVCMPSLITLAQFSTAPCIPVHNISRRNKKIVIIPWLPNKLILSTLFVKLSISFTLILTCQLRL